MLEHPLKIDYSITQIIGIVPGDCYGRSHISLSMAKAWMGKCLAALGEESPYKNDGRRERLEDIEETADAINVVDAIIKEYPDTQYPLSKAFITLDDTLARKEEGFTYFSDLTYIQKIDWLREQIQKIKLDFLTMTPIQGATARICVQNVYSHLTEARMYLRLQLKEFKEIGDKADYVK
jgi:hypothetical protein